VFQVRAPQIEPGFGPGACVGYRPLQSDRHFTVFVDPGHGGYDTGTFGSTTSGAIVNESTATLGVGLDLLGALRQAGFTVVLSRTADTSVVALGPSQGGVLSPDQQHRDLEARVACANAAQAGLLVSIHMNGYSDRSVGGAETIYCAARDFAPASLRLARLVQSSIAASAAVPDRGVLDDAGQGAPTPGAPPDYGHLHLLGPAYPGWNPTPTSMPGVVVEPLFLTDPHEANIAASPDGQTALARALAAAIAAYAESAAPGP